MARYRGRILITGLGIVAQALLPLRAHFGHRVRRAAAAQRWLRRGVRLVRERVTPSNLDRVLAKHAAPGDLIIDLTWSIDFCAIAEWARDHDVFYTNADKSLYSRYVLALERLPRCGLISHFVKR
jgi:homospermidine synthase